ncbi:unnamed protein product [Caenorhabditis auriculariae]|uniref:Uncharacterized protein n=1 Tax=Caenorhabditis auriculariae TaxID=2777116 RepID=A0A8S1HA77_9PELO|nr:unnamed protein product [Caenorhabditis auriculariae]
MDLLQMVSRQVARLTIVAQSRRAVAWSRLQLLRREERSAQATASSVSAVAARQREHARAVRSAARARASVRQARAQQLAAKDAQQQAIEEPTESAVPQLPSDCSQAPDSEDQVVPSVPTESLADVR